MMDTARVKNGDLAPARARRCTILLGVKRESATEFQDICAYRRVVRFGMGLCLIAQLHLQNPYLPRFPDFLEFGATLGVE